MLQQLTEPINDNQQTEAPIDCQFTEAPISIKQRKGLYIVTFDIVNIDKIDFNLHVNRCLQQNVFNALRKRTLFTSIKNLESLIQLLS